VSQSPTSARAEAGAPEPAPLWRVEAVARFLDVPVKMIYRMVALEGLPCVRLGRRIRFDPPDVVRWKDARKPRV